MTDDELDAALAALPYYSPGSGFDDRVMAQVAIAAPAQEPRRSLAAAVGFVFIVLGAMVASSIWTLQHQEAVMSVGQWLSRNIANWTWTSLRGFGADLAAWRGLQLAREIVLRPSQAVVFWGIGTLVYLTGLFALRRLATPPASRMSHARG